MAKSKAKRATKLYPLWREYNRELAKRAKKLSEVVGALVAADAVGFSRLGNSDEAVYTHLVGLMEAYRRVINFAGDPESSTVRVMIAGICEVLGARLREFEEVSQGDENPIAAEKQAIICDAVKNLQINGRENTIALFDIYRNAMHDCRTRIDDLHGRKIARLYIELIEREWEELGNIINVQVRALKETGARDAVIFSIADALGDVYLQTEPIVKNLRVRKTYNEGQITVQFENKILPALEEMRRADGKKFFAALDAQTVAAFDEIEIGRKKAAYNFRREIAGVVLLATEIRRVFENLHLPEIKNEILAGIRETFEIKISGLSEGIAEFEKNGEEIIKKFSSERPVTGLSAILPQVRDAWLENPPKESGTATFFENALAPCREIAKKHIDAYAQRLEKASLRFKKEVLLYEICTYEEILTHSVPRLRESDEAETAVSALDDGFLALVVILKKNNIEIIRPAAKSQFNAREHEVLVAEKNPDFRKGEIIKVMTAGYRFKEQVILRANVIAAR
ncbi:MAG: nucleotide exchange factor GrpE [Defluviitaleaceae bacterium]|nr:nucleotide exchange factor GrpE [Defluviitaleaceae bacterium]